MELGLAIANVSILLVGGIVGCAQLAVGNRARKAAVMADLFRLIHSPEYEECRRVMFRCNGPMSEGTVYASRRTIELFDWVSFMLLRRLVPRDHVLALYAGLIRQVWLKGQSIVQQSRVGSSGYAKHLEIVALLAAEYRYAKVKGDGDIESALSCL